MATLSTAQSVIFVGPGLVLNGSTLQSDFTSAVQLSGDIAATGAALVALINTSAAGVSSLNGASGILGLTGAGSVTVTTQGQVITISGGGGGAGDVTQAQLASTGQQAWTAANNNGLNLSGALLSVSGVLAARDLAISGALAAQIAGSTAGVSSVNGITGAVAIGGASNVFVTVSGQTVYVSGSGLATNADLVASGALLFARDASISGGLEARVGATGAASVAYTFAASGGLQAEIANLATLGQLASTGQQAWLAATNNAINLSGNLTQTGVLLIARDASISGGLDARIAATGAAAVAYGNLTFATITNLFNTGAAAITYANGISGGLEARLAATGAASVAYALGVSGGLQTLISALPTVAQVASTGQQAWTAADNNGRNLSGALTQTGVLLGASIALVAANTQANAVNLSGNLGATGAALIALISAAAAGVSSINGASGVLSLQGAGNVTVFTDGQTLTVSGDISALATKTALASTGQQAWNAANGNGVNLSGALFATGAASVVYTDLRVAATGAASVAYTDARVAASGAAAVAYVDVRVAATGAAADAYTDTRVAATGAASVAYTDLRVAASGAASVAYTDARVAATGAAAVAYAFGISGGLEARIAATGAAAVAYTDARVAATGGAAVAYTLSVSGGLEARIAASGAAEVAYTDAVSGGLQVQIGGFVTQAQLASTGQQAWNAANDNGINLSGSLAATGAAAVALNLSTSGALSTRLVATGFTSILYASGASGALQSQINALPTAAQLASTGQQAWVAGQNNALNLSGSILSASGALQSQISAGGTQVQVTGSSTLAVAAISGVGGVTATLAGSQVLISGVQPETFILSCSNVTTALAAAASVAYFDAPFAFSLYKASASVLGAPAGSAIQVDINTGSNANSSNVSILSTKITISGGTLTSFATIQPVITFSGVPSGTRVYVDIDSVGSANAGTGLNTTLYCFRNA